MADVPETRYAAAVRRQLIDLVRSQGPGLLDDGRRVRAMLADAVAGATAEANLIALALASGVPTRLREAEQDPARHRDRDRRRGAGPAPQQLRPAGRRQLGGAVDRRRDGL